MNSIENITRSLQVTRTLMVSSILIGEDYSGKLTLIKSLYQSTPIIDATSKEELDKALLEEDELIIYNLQAVKNIANLNFENKKIIAIATPDIDMKLIKTKFAFIYMMPSFKERADDVQKIAQEISQKVHHDLILENKIDLDYEHLDLSQNYKSLKASVTMQIIKKSLTVQDIEEILFNYFKNNLNGKDGYKNYLGIYERPLIQAGLQKYGSQLQLSNALGLNRNTLRKKINEHNIH